VTEKRTLLAEVARLYYEEKLTQSEIADKIYTSRSKVSRLLQEAKEKGVIEININYPWGRVLEMEKKLTKLFDLSTTRVLNSKDLHYDELLNGLGVLTSDHLDNIISEDTILGVSWGKTIYHVVNSLSPKEKVPIDVVQVIGAAGTKNPAIDAPDLIRQLATTYGGNYYYLHAPLCIENDEAQKALIKQPAIIETLSIAHRSDMLLTGIGSLNPNVSSTLWKGYLTDEEIENLRYKGAVGHICAHLYDMEGEIINTEKYNNVIGIGLEDLDKIDNVIGVAGSTPKAGAILGALRGNYIDTLITDDKTAQKVISMEEAE